MLYSCVIHTFCYDHSYLKDDAIKLLTTQIDADSFANKKSECKDVFLDNLPCDFCNGQCSL